MTNKIKNAEKTAAAPRVLPDLTTPKPAPAPAPYMVGGYKLSATFTARNVHVLQTMRRGAEAKWLYLTEYNGVQQFAIRKVYLNDADEWCPTSKGIAFDLTEKDNLIAHLAAMK